MDVRQVGNPDSLQGSHDTILCIWPTWSSFETWLGSQVAPGEAAPEWARGCGSRSILPDVYRGEVRRGRMV